MRYQVAIRRATEEALGAGGRSHSSDARRSTSRVIGPLVEMVGESRQLLLWLCSSIRKRFISGVNSADSSRGNGGLWCTLLSDLLLKMPSHGRCPVRELELHQRLARALDLAVREVSRHRLAGSLAVASGLRYQTLVCLLRCWIEPRQG